MNNLSRRGFLRTSAAGLAAGVLTPAFALRAEDKPMDSSSPTNAFACDLFAKLKSDAGNLFFSPYSIETCLAMTATGAAGNTLKEMHTVLHLPGQATENDKHFSSLMAAINPAGQKRDYELTTANAIWAQKGYPWRTEFKTRVTGNYGAGLKEVDFLTDPDGAMKACNAWVEKETKDKIKNILQKGDVTTDTRMLLANAIYFKGSWMDAFDKKLTTEAPFTQADGTKSNCKLMNRSSRFDYAESEGVQALSIPYKGKDLSMLILLPRTAGGIGKLQDSLTVASLSDWAGKLKSVARVNVALPQFKMETKYDLGKTLVGMGMQEAFSRNANFTAMQSGPERLQIGFVIHKAFVDVNEEGTEAAAATVTGIRMTASAPIQTKEFKADHPFVFAIRHNVSGTILFLGRVSKP